MANIKSVATGFKPTGAIHPVDQILPPVRLGVYGLQHVLAFYAGAVSLPLIQGVTFTAVAPMIAIGRAASTPLEGLLTIYGAVIVAGIVTFLIAPYYSRLLHLFPPVVTGTVITIIGVTLIPVAILSVGGGNPSAPDFASLKNLTFAAGTLVLILMIYRFFRGFMSSIAVLLGLVVGTAVAAAFGLVDFSGV